MNKKEIKQILHNIMWDYLDYYCTSEKEWNRELEDIYNKLKEKGILKE